MNANASEAMTLWPGVALARLGGELHETLIRPRIAALAQRFGALIEHISTCEGRVSTVRFERSARLACTATFGLGINWEHNAQYPHLFSTTQLIPAVVALPCNAVVSISGMAARRGYLAAWIEAHISRFLDAYLFLCTVAEYRPDILTRRPAEAARWSTRVSSIAVLDVRQPSGVVAANAPSALERSCAS